jgi:4-oxalocrotonate tautomerase
VPIIEVTLTPAPHRTPEVKRALITALTNAVVDTGVAPKEAVRVILREVPAENFAAGDVTLAERRAAQAAASASTLEEGKTNG